MRERLRLTRRRRPLSWGKAEGAGDTSRGLCGRAELRQSHLSHLPGCWAGLWRHTAKKKTSCPPATSPLPPPPVWWEGKNNAVGSRG